MLHNSNQFIRNTEDDDDDVGSDGHIQYTEYAVGQKTRFLQA
jgi:hypothetical protein